MLPPLTRVALLIKKRRQLLRLSQRQVSAAVGCNQSYLGQVETGRRPVPGGLLRDWRFYSKCNPVTTLEAWRSGEVGQALGNNQTGSARDSSGQRR